MWSWLEDTTTTKTRHNPYIVVFMVFPSCPTPPPSAAEAIFLPAWDLRNFYLARLLSPVDVTEAYIDRINQCNGDINAYVHTTFDLARTRAAESEARYRRGNPLPLDGIPTAIKDLFDFLADVPTTFGSKVFTDIVDFVPDHSAIYVQRLLDAGIVPLGKTNTPEFGHKGTTDNLAFGPTSTPFNFDYNAGGSSGGSAAAVASFMAALSEGSDAGGSVRIPAALCGAVGFKMTFGRIPQDLPVQAHTPFLHPGPITRTVHDTAMLADIMARPWTMDPHSLSDAPEYVTGINGGITGKKIAFSINADVFPIEDAVATVIRDSLNTFCQAGATVDETPLGLADIAVTNTNGSHPYTHTDGSDLWNMEQSVLYAHANDMLMQQTPDGPAPIDLRDHAAILTPRFLAMINEGYATSSVDYRHGEFLRLNGASGTNGINHAFETMLTEYDFIVTPTVAVAGIPNATDGNTLGPTQINGVPVDPGIGWALTYLQNFTGHPAISIPAGFTPEGLPVGLQVTGRRWDDINVLRAARAFEKLKPWYSRYPRLCA